MRSPPSSRAGVAAPVVGIVIAAFNLRIAILAVGPVIEEIRADLDMSSSAAGLLQTIPFLCMGVFALAGSAMLRRFGAPRLLAGCLTLILAGTLLRAVMPTPALLIAMTVVIGPGLALAGVALPALVKQHYPARAGTVTGAYVAAMSAGGALVALTMVPLSDALGGWREAFAVSALPALAALVLWIATVEQGERPERPSEPPLRLWPPSGRGLLLAVVFGLQSLCYSATVSWMPAVYQGVGWAPSTAALTVVVLSLLTIVGSLTAPRMSEASDRRRWVLVTALVTGVGLAGIAGVRDDAAWLWIVMFGIGSGTLFPLVLTLPLDLSPDRATVGRLTAMMLAAGYLVSALGPVVVGALRDATGSFDAGLWMLVAAAIASGLLAMHPSLRRAPA